MYQNLRLKGMDSFRMIAQKSQRKKSNFQIIRFVEIVHWDVEFQ